MALYQANNFSGFSDSYAVPSGVDQPLFSGSVDLILSIGITQQVFDTLSTAPKCIHFMEQQQLYSLSPNEGVAISNLRSKLLIFRKYLYQPEDDEHLCFYLSWKSGSSNSSPDG